MLDKPSVITFHLTERTRRLRQLEQCLGEVRERATNHGAINSPSSTLTSMNRDSASDLERVSLQPFFIARRRAAQALRNRSDNFRRPVGISR